jgi:acyl transferase domain-containing protein
VPQCPHSACSGTNAHVILEQTPAIEASSLDAAAGTGAETATGAEPAAEEAAASVRSAIPAPWLLSAKTPTALRAQAARLHELLAEQPTPDPADIAHALATTRALFEHRAVVLPERTDQYSDALATLAQDQSSVSVVRGHAVAGGGKIAFLFTGQGSQRAGMGWDLYQSSPVFAAALDEVTAALDAHLDQPLKDLIFAQADTPEADLLDQTQYTRSPRCSPSRWRCSGWLESFGTCVPTSSPGTRSANSRRRTCRGVLSLEDAATLVTARARLMQSALPQNAAR